MTRVLLCLALLAPLAAGGSDAAKKDLEKLQGEWVMTGMEVNGQDVAAKRLEGTVLTVKGDQYVVKTKRSEQRCRITLDPAKDPKTIDMHFEDGDKKDQTGKGIYRIDGDTFKFVRGLNPDQERPREFGTWPGTNVFMVTWKRK